MNIVKTPSAVPLVDLMQGAERWEINVDGQHGVVALVDMMPRLVPEGRTADIAVLRAARTSVGQGLKSPAEDRGTQRYLMRHAHTTPTEMVEFTFHHVLPIFVARQLIRHRTASVNEYSLRYSEAKDRFWFPPNPEYLRAQSKAGSKQHTEGGVDLVEAAAWIENLHHQADTEMKIYKLATEKVGIGRELARVNLPVNLYTEWYWKIDLHNLLRTLSLRMDTHAQAEIRVYADAMYKLIKPMVPVAIEAFDDYDVRRGGLLLSALDLRAIRGTDPLDEIFPNTRELGEFLDKMRRMGTATDRQCEAVGLLNARAEKKGTS